MNGKALLLLGLAAACGLTAMFGVQSLLDRPQGATVPMSRVLVAAQEIRVEQTIGDELVTLKEIPAEMVPPGALTEPKQALGRWAMIRILPGDVILDGKLAQKGTPVGMIARITPGMRAFAIRVDEQSGVSGFILPDYRVDVLQPRHDQPGRADVVLENVRVLASGQIIESPEERAIEANTVTLEVSPDQVLVLANAMQRGSLTLALRGLNDVELHAPPPEPGPGPPSAPGPAALADGEGGPPVTSGAPPPVAEPIPRPGPPRRLTVFAGRTPPRMHRVGERPTRAAPPEAGPVAPDARGPSPLDGPGGPPPAPEAHPPGR